MANIMNKVVEIIVLVVGALIVFGGGDSSIYGAFINATGAIGGPLGATMSLVLSIVIPLVFLFVGLEVAFPGAVSKRIG
jgi:hypothetical protein